MHNVDIQLNLCKRPPLMQRFRGPLWGCVGRGGGKGSHLLTHAYEKWLYGMGGSNDRALTGKLPVWWFITGSHMGGDYL